MKFQDHKSKRGFTLIELLLVMSIISLFSSITLVNVTEARARARDVRRIQDIKTIVQAIQTYYIDYGRWPYLTAGQASTINTCGGNGGAPFCNTDFDAGRMLTRCNSYTPCDCLVGDKPNTLAWLVPLDGGWTPHNKYFNQSAAPRDPLETACRLVGEVPVRGPDYAPFYYTYEYDFDPDNATGIMSLRYFLERPVQGAPGIAINQSCVKNCEYIVFGDDAGNIQ